MSDTTKAQRSGQVPPYRLIYKGLLEDLAWALKEGHEKYSEGEFDRNWQKGDQQFFRECFDHLKEHLDTYNETGNRYHNGEDHLAHAVANLMFLMWAEDFKKINWPWLEQERIDSSVPFDESEALNDIYADWHEDMHQAVKDDEKAKDVIAHEEAVQENWGLRKLFKWKD